MRTRSAYVWVYALRYALERPAAAAASMAQAIVGEWDTIPNLTKRQLLKEVASFVVKAEDHAERNIHDADHLRAPWLGFLVWWHDREVSPDDKLPDYVYPEDEVVIDALGLARDFARGTPPRRYPHE